MIDPSYARYNILVPEHYKSGRGLRYCCPPAVDRRLGFEIRTKQRKEFAVFFRREKRESVDNKNGWGGQRPV